jgi:hypothetical protein
MVLFFFLISNSPIYNYQMKKLVYAAVIVVLLSTCSTTKQWRQGLEKEWLGKTKDELVSKRGEPYQINSVDIKGTDIYIYHHIDFTPDIPPNDYYEEFFVNAGGRIYKIETYRR